jgi:hypothetical protein
MGINRVRMTGKLAPEVGVRPQLPTGGELESGQGIGFAKMKEKKSFSSEADF